MRGLSKSPPDKSRRHFFVDAKGRVRPALGLTRGALPLTLAGAATLIVADPYTSLGGTLAASGRAAMKSAVELIRSRSPGLRRAAHLVKTKHARPLAAARPRIAARPAMRAKPRLLRPAAAFAPTAAPPPALPLALNAPPLVAAYTPVGEFPVAPITADTSCLCQFVYVPPDFGGGGLVFGPPPGGGTTPPPPETPPGVPEPQSWTLMILGFGVLGTLWRRRRRLLALIKRIPQLTYQRFLRLTYAPQR